MEVSQVPHSQLQSIAAAVAIFKLPPGRSWLMRLLATIFMPALLSRCVTVVHGCTLHSRKLNYLSAAQSLQQPRTRGYVAVKAATKLAAVQPSIPRTSRCVGGACGSTVGRRTVVTAALAFMVPPIIIQPKATHTSTVIMLHGLGDTGDGCARLLQLFLSPSSSLNCLQTC